MGYVPIDKERLRTHRKKVEAETGGAGYFSPKEGEYLIYVCWPMYDGLPYLECFRHSNLGPKANGFAACLDPRANALLNDDRLTRHLETVDISGGCPACKRWDETKNKEEKKRFARRRAFLFNFVVLATRDDPMDDWKPVKDPQIERYRAGVKVYEGVTDVILTEGDICNPDAPVFIRFVRKGSKQFDTEYRITAAPADSPGQREPLKKAVKRMVEKALVEDGPCDPFVMAAADVRSTDDLERLCQGLDVVESEDEEEQEPEEPSCFKIDYIDDDECKVCPWRWPCSQHLKVELYPDHVPLSEGDVGYEEWQAAQTKTASRGRVGGGKAAEEAKAKAAEEAKAKAAEEAKAKAAEEAKAAKAARTVKAKAKAKAKAAEEVDPQDEALGGLGYDAKQIARMQPLFKTKMIKYKIPATAVSVTKDGKCVIFRDRLPEEHPMWEPPEEEEPEEEEGEEEEPEEEEGEDDDLDALERELRAATR